MKLASPPYPQRLAWLLGPGQSGTRTHAAAALVVDPFDISLPPGLTSLFDDPELCCRQAARLDRFAASA